MTGLKTYHMPSADDFEDVVIEAIPSKPEQGWMVPFFDRNYDWLERIANVLNTLEAHADEAEARLLLAQAGITRPK